MRARGKPGPELERLIRDARAGTVPGCSQFLDVLDIYEGRNTIVHEGRLRPTIFEPARIRVSSNRRGGAVGPLGLQLAGAVASGRVVLLGGTVVSISVT